MRQRLVPTLVGGGVHPSELIWGRDTLQTLPDDATLLFYLCTTMRLIWRNKSGLLYIPVTTDSGALEAITVAIMRFRALIQSYLCAVRGSCAKVAKHQCLESSYSA